MLSNSQKPNKHNNKNYAQSTDPGKAALWLLSKTDRNGFNKYNIFYIYSFLCVLWMF